MSIERNKAVVRQWIESVNKGDPQGILALLTDDFRFITMARRPEELKLELTGEQFANMPASMSEAMETPIQLEIVSMIGEGDHVAAEARTDSKLRNGLRYDNAYHFGIDFAGEKISQVREYSCSFLAAECFAGFKAPQAA